MEGGRIELMDRRMERYEGSGDAEELCGKEDALGIAVSVSKPPLDHV